MPFTDFVSVSFFSSSFIAFSPTAIGNRQVMDRELAKYFNRIAFWFLKPKFFKTFITVFPIRAIKVLVFCPMHLGTKEAGKLR